MKLNKIKDEELKDIVNYYKEAFPKATICKRIEKDFGFFMWIPLKKHKNFTDAYCIDVLCTRNENGVLETDLTREWITKQVKEWKDRLNNGTN